ncbi:alpha/beta hydrolase [Hyphomicrobium sp.]|uniref:alpha/beta hydrolase n=1 Tax=Hyphomicrobium sp. TaxID=82 RepID=UPI002E379284|nr:alpha/beta fold hydrolase [Hyphomicrobium sp.]HEX2841650.1 alpha/beta fold hydrolase [Hyphomicrobium sp.]
MTAFLDRRAKFRTLNVGSLPPALAGDVAYRQFLRPKLSSRRSADHTILAERARFHLRNADWVRVPTTRGDVQCYVFEPDGGDTRGSVLIAHGWTSEASFMAVFAEQLRRAGFRVVMFDQPGHGKSEQERASLIDCAHALQQVVDAIGPVRFAVTHSMGGLAALLAGEGRRPLGPSVPFERYVLVSSPNRFAAITQEFADELALGEAAQRAYERHLERIAHRPVADFTAGNLLETIGCPALVIHSRDDTEVGFESAEEIAAQCPKAQLMAVDGLGHRNILFAPPVIRGAISYLTSS